MALEHPPSCGQGRGTEVHLNFLPLASRLQLLLRWKHERGWGGIKELVAASQTSSPAETLQGSFFSYLCLSITLQEREAPSPRWEEAVYHR